MNIFSELTTGHMALLCLGFACICFIPIIMVSRYQSSGRKLWDCRTEIETMLKGTSFCLKIITKHSWSKMDYSYDRYGVFTNNDIQDGLTFGLSTVKFLKYIRKVKAGKMTLDELRLKCLACAAAHNKSEAKRNSL